MRHLRVSLVLVALCAIPLAADYYDFEQITVANVSIGFTSSKITPANLPPVNYADCRVRTAEISVLWVDPAKTAVTTTVGQLLEPGDRIVLVTHETILNFRAIRTGGTSGQLDCAYRTIN